MQKTPQPCSDEMRARLTGPVPDLRLPFDREGNIDFDSIRRQIDFVIAAGAKTVMLTVGDTHYIALTEKEIGEVTKVTLEHTAGRAMVIAADRYYHTAQSIEFAKYAKGLGAGLLMVLPPDWAGSCTPQSLAAHYGAVAQVMPVMVVTNLFISRGSAFGLETLKLLHDTVDNVVAVKDDMCGEFARAMSLLVHDRWAVVSGGRKENHLNNHPYGCDGYLSTFMSFRPAVSHDYWRAIVKNDLAAAAQIIRDIDYPFFFLVSNVRGGFDAGIHATLELMKISPRWRRPPYHSLTDAEMEEFGASLRTLRIIP